MKKFMVFILAFMGMFISNRMTAQIFINFDNVDGESVATGHEKEMEVLSISMGSSISSATGSGGIAAARISSDRVKFDDIAITKMRGSSSGTLQTKQFSGQMIAKATINFFKRNDKAPYMTITLTGVRISSMAFSGNGTEQATETISLNYQTIKIEESYTMPNGSVKKSVAKWNLAENSANVQ